VFLIRTLHKWFGLILGLQFLLWSISGAMMAMLDAKKVAAEDSERAPPALSQPLSPIRLASLAQSLDAPILRARLRPLGEHYVYEVETPLDLRLFDAATGAPVTIDAPRAQALAQAGYAGSGAVASVEKVEKVSGEVRGVTLPVWRVAFADPDHTTLFVDPRTGAIHHRVNDTTRTWNLFWMIHIMDYPNGAGFNHPLIVTVATGCVWLALSGFILLVRSFRRQDFAYVLDPIDKLRGR
jgi:uncharacterized iron-regulated membrane protein